MSNITTTWIIDLADRISRPVQNLTNRVMSATRVGDRMNDIYSRSERIFQRAGTAAMGAASKIKLMKDDLIDAAAEIPGFDKFARILKNPLTGVVALGSGLVVAGKKAYDFKQGMAEINATAQLNIRDLAILESQLISIGKDSGGNFAKIPKSFEAINSVLGELDVSLDVLNASVFGSKAGFTDLDVVATALAKTMSIVGAENATAREVLDTFMMAKNVGAGEFEDFANYMPSLISSGKTLGIQYQDVAGIFAYMSGKAANASEATMLIGNAFTALGKSDVREKLAKNLGVSLFDEKGMTKNIGDVVMEMSEKFSGLTPEMKTNMIEKIGFTDTQAKTAFSMLLGDAPKLKGMMDQTNNSLGATQAALEKTNSPARTWAEALDRVSFWLVKIGDKVLPVFDAGVRGVISVLQWFEKPIVQDVLEGIGNGFMILWKVLKWPTIAVIALTAAFAAFNFVMSISPLGWIIIAFFAIVTAISLAVKHFDKFKAAILGVWEVIKGFGNVIKEMVLDNIQRLLTGLGSLGKAFIKFFKGDFKGAWEDAKTGAENIISLNPLSTALRTGEALYNQGKKSGELFKLGYEKGLDKENVNGANPLVKTQAATADNQTQNTEDLKAENKTKDNTVSGDGAALGGNGGGKTITMHLDFKQYFSVGKDSNGDVVKIANKVIEVVTDRLRDGLIALE